MPSRAAAVQHVIAEIEEKIQRGRPLLPDSS
jgi:hypothetical protein